MVFDVREDHVEVFSDEDSFGFSESESDEELGDLAPFEANVIDDDDSMGLIHVRCWAHSFQLLVGDAIKGNDTVKRGLKLVKRE